MNVLKFHSKSYVGWIIVMILRVLLISHCLIQKILIQVVINVHVKGVKKRELEFKYTITVEWYAVNLFIYFITNSCYNFFFFPWDALGDIFLWKSLITRQQSNENWFYGDSEQ